MEEKSYRTVKGPAEGEFTERKSRFIGAIAPVKTEEEAQAFLQEVRARHREARHNCFAYVLRDNNTQRFSDDGEPQGTAGKPILEVLLREKLTDVAVVVTRYFGGVLLGTGGLYRAYSEGCRLAVEAAEKLMMHPATELLIPMDYAFYGKLQYLLPDYKTVILDTDFGEEVTQKLMIPTVRLPALLRDITEASAGSVHPEVTGERFWPFPET